MKRLLLSLVLTVSTMLSTVWAYDFSAVSPSGHTLYFIINLDAASVCITHPGYYHYPYDGYTKPTGNLVIPSSVTHNGTTYSVTTIGSFAFKGCDSLTSVSIPNSVTTIGNNAFKNCSGLISIIIPNGVTYIGSSTFSGCSSLTSIIIPNSVTSIGDGAFYDCNSLTTITIPNGITFIGEETFYGCSSLTTLNFNAINCNDFISSNFSYCPFGNCPISTINIGDSVQRIPVYFAYSLDSLSTLTIGNSVTSIGEYAFRYCSSLNSVTIPNSVTSIGSYAFNGCSSLNSVTIPNSVTSIGSYAFNGCSSLTTLNFNAINCSDFSSSNHPFSSCPISTINIGDSVQCIPKYFAYNNSSLSAITIPNSVTSIGDDAFKNCNGLTTLNFNAINCNGFSYSHMPFSRCPISTINIGSNVQHIPANFARNNTYLSSITIPNSVTFIEGSAFEGCSRLTTLNFNAINCNDFDYSPFHDCPVSTITIGDSVQYIPTYFVSGNIYLSAITIPNSVTSVGACAFLNCRNLESVIIGNNVDSIKFAAFYGCTSLTSINMGYSIVSIGNWAFMECSSLTTVTIPENVTSIEPQAFYDCENLRTLNFNATNCSDFYIGEYGIAVPFHDPISTINIGNNVERIPAGFAMRLNLSSITIPNNVTSIGDSAFYGCYVNHITIGNSVTTIGDRAFYGCNNRSYVTSLAMNPPTLSYNSFSNSMNKLYIPCGSLSNYRNTTWDTIFSTIIEDGCDNITITVTSANENMGTVSGGGEYAFGAQVTITAIPNQGYRFVCWNDGNTDNPRTITVTEEATYIASFAEGVGIESANELDNLTFYPNPTKGILNFSMDVEKIEVMDMMGKMVMQFCNVNEINIASLPKGVYCLRLSYNGKITVHKIIKE